MHLRPLQKLYRLVAICSFMLLPASIAADLLRLRSGETIAGFYVEEQDEGVLFLDRDGKERVVARSDIESLTMGYSGAPVCFQLRDSEEKNCDAILHDVSEDELVIAEGEGFTNLRRIPMDELVQAELTRAREFQRFSSILKPGVRVRMQSGETTISGRVTGVDGGALVVEDSEGRSQTLAEQSVAALIVEPAPGIDFSGGYWRYVPGLPQLEAQRDWQGWSMLGGSAAVWTLFYVEYRAAASAAQAASSDLSVLLFYNTSHLEQFNRHQANQRRLAVLGAAIYLWHWIDLWFWQPGGSAEPAAPESQAPALRLMPRAIPAAQTSASGAGYDLAFELSWTVPF